MLPAVFLSLSGKDLSFVERVNKNLPGGLAYYYPKSFENGEDLLSAMEKRVGESTIFALFASKASISSVWVNFEIEKARLSKIKNGKFRILVFPIEAGVRVGDLPEWMQAYWIGSAGLLAKDVARYIRNILTNSHFDSVKSSQVFGRGQLIDQISGQYLTNTVVNNISPNVIVLGGYEGIGRRTLSKKLLEVTHPALSEIGYGPEFPLPQFSDLEDIYRALRQEINDEMSAEEIIKEGEHFRELNQEEKITEVCRCLSYFGKMNQAVWIISGNGIFEDRGTLKSWVPGLFSELMSRPEVRLCIISNRLIYDAEARPHKNVFQAHVGNITDSDIKTLMMSVSRELGGVPIMPSDSILSGIGGHPQIAKIAARIAASQGIAILEHDPKKLYDIQEEILGSSVDLTILSEDEQKILSLLSWVPRLNSEILAEVMIGKEGQSGKDFSDCLSNLERSCLIQSVGSSYNIASPIRMLFRRKYGYGSESLRTGFSEVLKYAGEKAKHGDQIDLDLIDAVVFMASIEGGTLDPTFQKLLLPSTLQSVIKSTYDSRSHDEDALDRVVAWGASAKDMRMDEATREEILSYVIRAQCRLGKGEQAEKLLEFFDAKVYRSRHYLWSFFFRYCGGSRSDAIRCLKEAYKVKKYMKSVVADLALCYQKEGAWTELFKLIEDEGDRVDNNAGLLDVKAGIQISRRDYEGAEITIRKLNSHSLGDGRGNSRMAMIMMHRDQNYSGAQAFLTKCLQEKGTNLIPTRRLRGIAAAYAGDRTTVESDISFLRPKVDGIDTSHRLMARLLLTEGSLDDALTEVSKISRRSHQDGLLRAKIIDAQAESPKTPLSLRKSLQEESRQLKIKHSVVSEFEFE